MKLFLMITLTLAALASQAAVTPMNLVEKSSYRLAALVKKGEIPSYLSTDLAQIQIRSVTLANGAAGTSVAMLSHSQNPDEPNSVTVFFSADGKIQSYQTHVVSQSGQGPIFTKADGATLLDLGAEAVVDHLSEDANLPAVAKLAENIDLVKDNGALFLIHLKDGRTFRVLLDLDGKFVSRGF